MKSFTAFGRLDLVVGRAFPEGDSARMRVRPGTPYVIQTTRRMARAVCR